LDRLLGLENRLPVGAPWRRPKPEEHRVAISAAPNQSAWPQEALQRLEQQGLEAYRAYCAELLLKFGGSANSPLEQNNLAWACVLGPDAVSDPNRVVQLAQRAVASAGRNPAYLNTLGVALYRAGRFEEAIDKLSQSMAAGGQGGIPEDWFFLAMAHAKLSNDEKAKEWMDRATRATAGAPPKPEWAAFRREADAILGGKDLNEVLRGPNSDVPAKGRDRNQIADSEAAAAPFVIRSFGFGQLVRMVADPFPGAEVDWAWLFNTLQIERLRWSERHGMAGSGENDDFWNFLIAGVGRAPVGAFQVLITVFAVVIGPVNYFFFRQRRRLYLLILTVPALAIAVSGILFGYSLASDGFAVRTRVRSITLLDQVRGEGVSLSRISYYAGLAPTGGLRFSSDTAVFPIRPESEDSDYRVVDWTEQQHLSSGWLRSRTPAQFLTVGCRPVGEQLTIGPDAAGVIRVTNNLGAAIQLLVVCDADGALHVAENIAKGARASARSEDAAAVHEMVRAIIVGQRLEAPREIADHTSWGLFRWSGASWGNSVTPSWGVSLLEQSLRQFSGATPPRPYLQPRSYLAVTERPSYVELGVTDTRDDDCLYVTLGSY
jgi:tetratricopeptide (TPR) repeat protein